MRNDVRMVQRILKEKGTSTFVLKQITSEGIVDPSKPSQGPVSTTQSFPMQSFPGSVGMAKGFFQGQKVGELIQMDDILLLVDPSSLDTTPSQSDEVVRNDQTYKIKNIFIYEVSDVVVLYGFLMRK